MKPLVLASILALAGCSAAGGSQASALSSLSRHPAEVANGLPATRTTIVKLIYNGFNANLQPVAGGDAAQIVAAGFSKWQGVTVTIVSGPHLPAGVPAPSGAKKLLFVVSLTVNKLAYSSGTQWSIQPTLPSCPTSIKAAIYSTGRPWSVAPGEYCADIALFPQWTVLRPGSIYAVAVYQ